MQHTLCVIASAPSLEVVGSKRNLVTPLLRPGPVRVEMIDNAFPGIQSPEIPQFPSL